MDSTLRGGWYQYSKENYGILLVRDVIKEIASFLHVKESNILLYGSSQGGFTALSVNAFLPFSIALAESPQIDLSILTSVTSKPDRLAMCKRVFGCDHYDDIPIDQTYRISIFSLYKKYRHRPRNVSILVKETDKTHLMDHIVPFIDQYPEVALSIIKGEEGKGGHTAISRSIVVDYIKSIFCK